jgi:hypothetical protein
MKSFFKMSVVLALAFGINVQGVVAQCAMCRATVENNISDGGASFAAGLNTGILYLGAFPYLLVVLIAYLWLKASRKYTEDKKAKYKALVK